jgi:hypothetical protein
MTGRYKAIIAADRSQKAENQRFAEVARQRAARETAGSLERKAAGCLAVALSTTGTIASAMLVLDMVAQADVRNTAKALLDSLTSNTGEINPCPSS